MWFLLSLTAQAQTAADITAALERFNEQAKFPVLIPEEKDLERLVAHKVVRTREMTHPDKPQRVLGYYVMYAELEDVWVSARDQHLATVDDLIDHRLEDHDTFEVWYQHIDLPWPFVDRHWLLNTADNRPLAKSNVGWEHWWELSEDGPARAVKAISDGKIPEMSTERATGAIYVPDNEGAYSAIPLSKERTLFVFHATSTVGGNIPDKLIATYTLVTMNKFMTMIEERVPEALRHYSGDHVPIKAATGTPIPLGPSGAP